MALKQLKPKFEYYSGYILDLDGVIWVGEKPLPEAIEAVKRLKEIGKKVLFVSNNSTKSRKDYEKRLRNLGLDAKVEDIINSGYATAVLLREKYRKGDVYVVGEKGLVEELENQGFRVVSREECWEKGADFVVVGMDRGFDYWKIATAMRAIRRGALYIATNADKTFPSEKGLLPGAGTMIAAISTASGKDPDIIVGKPSKHIFEITLKNIGLRKEEVLVVGDRIDTDIEGAHKAGISSLLILTGVTSKEEVEKSQIKPDFVLSSLKELFYEA
jgi:HAD superfamily hydrolase (TIGR01457 family)